MFYSYFYCKFFCIVVSFVGVEDGINIVFRIRCIVIFFVYKVSWFISFFFSWIFFRYMVLFFIFEVFVFFEFVFIGIVIIVVFKIFFCMFFLKFFMVF